MRNIRCESICNLVWGTLMQRAVRNAVEYLNYICHTYEPGSIWCNITIKDGASGNFYLLNASFSRVVILFVEFILSSAYSISAKKLEHTPHKVFLCIVEPDINRTDTLVEAILKEFGKHSGLTWVIWHRHP